MDPLGFNFEVLIQIIQMVTSEDKVGKCAFVKKPKWYVSNKKLDILIAFDRKGKLRLGKDTGSIKRETEEGMSQKD